MRDESINDKSQELIRASKELVTDSKKLIAHGRQIRKRALNVIKYSRKTEHPRNDSDTDKTY